MTIRELCEKYNISQSGLARRFGIPLRTVQGWYLGERKPPEYVVRMIYELLLVDAVDETRQEPLNMLEAQVLIESGMTVVEVADKVGVHPHTLYNRLKGKIK